MPRMDPRLHTSLPQHFEWANSAHTGFKDAHIIVLEREVWVSVGLPRKRRHILSNRGRGPATGLQV